MEKYTFADRLVKLMEERKERKITQAELGEKLNLTRQAISSYITGASHPDCDKLLKIADFFNVSTDFLLGKTEVETTEEDVKIACKVTGLTEKAIKSIKNLEKDNSKTLSELLILNTLFKAEIITELVEAFNVFLQLATSQTGDSSFDGQQLPDESRRGIASFNLNLNIANILEKGKDTLLKEYLSCYSKEGRL